MSFRKLILLLAIFTLTTVRGESLLNVRHYSLEDGLSQNTIQSILQDDKGYIWLATWNGLERFDGYSFKNYKSYPTDRVRLSYNRITHIEKGFGSHIWCQTFGGHTYLFDSDTEQFLNPLSEQGDFISGKSPRIFPLKKGVTWVVTPNGELYRVDEKRLTGNAASETCENIETLPNDIYTIAEDAEGQEWILTRSGTYIYNQPFESQETFRHFCLVDSTAFLASADGRLFSYTARNKLQECRLPASFRYIDGLYALQEGTLCIATRQLLLLREKDGRFASIGAPDETSWRINRLHQSQDGAIWFFDGFEKIWRIDPSDKQARPVSYAHESQKRIRFIHEDAFGGIWIQPYYGAFSYYDPGTNTLKPAWLTRNGQKASYQAAGYEYLVDNHKNLWLCAAEGFDCLTFTPRRYTLLGEKEYGIEGLVRGLLIDHEGRLWCATKQGTISLYDTSNRYIGNLTRQGEIVPNRHAVFGSNAYTLFEDSLQRIWIGCKDDGLFIATPLNGGRYRIRHYRHNDKEPYSLSNNSVYDIRTDKRGRIWIGTYGGGLNLVENSTTQPLRFLHGGNKLKTFPPEAVKIRHICPTDSDVILVATTGGLLTFDSRFANPEELTFHLNRSRQNQASSLSNNDVMHVCQRACGDLYVVPYSGGISRIVSDNLLSDSIEFEHFNKRNGLPSDLTYAITEAGDSILWITFQNGICRYDPQTHGIETYDRFNLSPLTISEVPPVIDKQGRLYMGTAYGTLCLDLGKIGKSDIVPPLVFTQMQIPGTDGHDIIKPIIGDTLTLSPRERNISLTFAALDYTASAAIQYAYRIKERSDTWNNLSDNRTVSFAGLPAGEWDLEIRSTNGDGVWCNNNRTLHLSVTPTFKETPWAILLYVCAGILLALLISGIFIYIANLRRSITIEQQVTQLKLKFFTDISHELRTPLTLIAAPLETTLRQDNLPADTRNNLRIAQRNVHRMLQLINQILDFRKAQNGKMELHITRVDLCELSRHTYESFEYLARKRHIDYTFTVSESPIFGYTDADKVEKILFNLLSNAFKYTPEGKHIGVSLQTADNRLFITVHDEGQGIAPEKIGKIFNRFETLGNPGNILSSGIGLSLVQELIQILHGEIQVESTLGRGSSFRVTLPISASSYPSVRLSDIVTEERADLPREEDITGKREGGDESILIVEDNDELRHFIKYVLQDDYNIITASNGKEGLDKTLSDQPSLIISDIMMPVMDGIEFLNAVKQNNDISHTMFILLSAKTSVEDRIKGLEYGADDYITKPFSPSYLKARVHNLLQKRRGLKTWYLHQTDEKAHHQATSQLTRFDDAFIRDIIQEIENNIQNSDFKIEDLADTQHISRTVFYRKIKSLTGSSPIDLVQEIRIKKAIDFLQKGNLRVSEIAYRCGFSSPQYFSRVFKEKTGQSPTEYKGGKND